jgi:hypothetical protein
LPPKVQSIGPLVVVRPADVRIPKAANSIPFALDRLPRTLAPSGSAALEPVESFIKIGPSTPPSHRENRTHATICPLGWTSLALGAESFPFVAKESFRIRWQGLKELVEGALFSTITIFSIFVFNSTSTADLGVYGLSLRCMSFLGLLSEIRSQRKTSRFCTGEFSV